MSPKLFASFEQKGAGVSQTGLSLAGIASYNSGFKTFLNPSLLGTGKNSISLFYKNHFGIKEIRQIGLDGRFSLSSHPVGIGISQFGNKLYSEVQLTVASSYEISDEIMLGASSSFYFLEIKNYNNDWTYGLSLSVLYKISPQINIAAVFNNFNEPELGASKETLPVSGTIGVMYSPIQDIELVFDMYKEDLFDIEYRLGTRISVIEGINFLAGFQENINSFSSGLEYLTSSYSIKYAVDIHPVLNASHALGFSYAF